MDDQISNKIGRMIQTAEDWKIFIEQYVSLIENEFAIWEAKISDSANIHDLAVAMPALITLVNTLGYFRGQDGVFSSLNMGIRLEMNNQLYEYENTFNKRLQKLIDVIMQSEEKNIYIQTLQNYFINSRIG
ncbi:MAG TPA: hypothetical protein PLX79_00080 [Candidatus Dojkabacteria bacterium]|nr:hypothetical protein [Candidatus Dojkabacteria bacterium]